MATVIGGSRVSWLQEPCPFPKQLGSNNNMCEYCNEPFTFLWSGRNVCDYCGGSVHSRCSVRVKGIAGTTNKRVRICMNCVKYREEYSPLLRIGDDFICYNSRLPAASYLYLSECKRSLLITMDPSDQLVELPLDDIVRIQKGFSHAGHVNASNHYDPLRCFSILVRATDTTTETTYNLKTHSTFSCQLWVNGLNAALSVYRRILEQEAALERRTSTTNHSSSGTGTTASEPMDQSDDSMVIISSTCVNNVGVVSNAAPELLVIDLDENHNSRGSTPVDQMGELSPSVTRVSSPVVHKAHYKIRTVASPYQMVVPRNTRTSPQPTTNWDTISNSSSTDWRTKTTESTVSSTSSGLPYKGHKNPLASYCSCHAYAIEPSSAMLVSKHDQTGSHKGDDDPFKSCCQQCRDKCRLIKDLSLF